ncbi:hypothetical protein L7F22_053816 [Adiantum nelumboides]|nr:hypothetical protein [Adiantum nelumboides]
MQMANLSSPFLTTRVLPLDVSFRQQQQPQLLIVNSSSVFCCDSTSRCASAEIAALKLASFPTLNDDGMHDAQVHRNDHGSVNTRTASPLGVSLLQGGNLHVDSCTNGAFQDLKCDDSIVDDIGSPRTQQAQLQQHCPANSHSCTSNWKLCHESRLIIQTFCNEGHLDKAMDVLRHMPKCATNDAYRSLLKLCTKTKSLTYVKVVCAHLVQHRLELTGFLGDFLVLSLARCGAVEDAQEIANRLVRRTVFSWTAIISAYVNRGDELEGLKLYERMRKEGVRADAHTFASLLKACGNLHDLAWGKIIHADARNDGLATENFVGNSLVTMYGKCGDIHDTESAFLDMAYRDVVSWTAMLSAYVEQGQSRKALQLFRQMQEEGISPNRLTCVSALQACVSFAELEEVALDEGSADSVALEIGQALHAYTPKKDLATDAFVGTTLLSMYGSCGNLKMAESMFNRLPNKCIVSYNAMLAAYVDHSHGARALLFFKSSVDEGMTPDKLTYVSAIQAWSTLADTEVAKVARKPPSKIFSLKIGLALHIDVCMEGLDSNLLVDTALVTMYGKCGCIDEAEDVFNEMSMPDIVSWTALFSAYVEQGQGERALNLHREMQKQKMLINDVLLMLSWTAMLSGFIEKGQGEEALNLYKLMEKEGVLLDDVALMCVLQACCLTGSLNVCKKVHSRIVCAGYDISESVAATLILAYGNCGSMGDAQAVFDNLSEPDIVSWSASLLVMLEKEIHMPVYACLRS